MKMDGEGLMMVLERIRQRRRSWQTSFDTIPSIDSPLDRLTPLPSIYISTLATQFGLGVAAVLAQLAITFFNDVHLDLYTLNEGLLCGASFAVTVSFIQSFITK